MQFDYIIHTDKIRTRDTAHIIGENIGFTGEYIMDDRFAEQSAGEYAGKTLGEIAKSAGMDEDTAHSEIRKIYKNNSKENLEQFEKRIENAYQSILKEYSGKRILIV